MSTKISQNDLRKLMSEHKNKTCKSSSKIENPLAKYNDAGQLMCVLCKSIVRSEAVWPVHVNSKQHRENIAEAKRLKEKTENFTKVAKASKRPPTIVSNSIPEKKIKGILKNAPASTTPLPSAVPPDFFDNTVPTNPSSVLENNVNTSKGLPKHEDEKEDNVDATPGTSVDPIPEGFFDDPKMDAKARNKEYKDPVEEEWEKFQKEIKEEASQSAAIIAGEQEEATAERQLDEIDEQLRNWSRVLDLELKKEETSKKVTDQSDTKMETNENSSDSEVDVDEFLDWRAKKLYR